MGCRSLVAIFVAALLVAATACSPGGAGTASAPLVDGAYELTGALWWNGDGFAPRTVHVADGRFVAAPVPGAKVVDLAGRYALPALGEAHNHNVDKASTFERRNAEYLEQGIFYVKNPNNPTRLSDAVRRAAAGEDTLDVALANAGLTRPGGHPEALYRMLGECGVYGEPYESVDNLVEDSRWAVATVAELREVWPRVVAGEPDFVKLYLLESDGRPGPSYGLSPEVFREAVRLAREAGLATSVHVNTTADFRLAVEAGVDEINHLPGRRVPDGASAELYRIPADVAQRAAEHGVVVVTTAVVARNGSDLATLERSVPVMKENIDTLLAAGVPIALGSDDYFSTTRDEAEYLHELGALSPAEILHAWAVVAPKTIFPSRAVGGTAPGDEASFIALACDPLADFACVRRIRASMKQGHWIKAPP